MIIADKILGESFTPKYAIDYSKKEIFITFTEYYRIFGVEIALKEPYKNGDENNIEIYGYNDESRDLCRSNTSLTHLIEDKIVAYFCSTNILVKFITINCYSRLLSFENIWIYRIKPYEYTGKLF